MFLCVLVYQFFTPQHYLPQSWGIYIGITLLYWVTGILTLRFLGTENFGYAMMVSKMVRMLVSAASLLAYIMISGDAITYSQLITLAFVMLFLYFGYLLFEIRALLPNLQRNSKQDN